MAILYTGVVGGRDKRLKPPRSLQGDFLRVGSTAEGGWEEGGFKANCRRRRHGKARLGWGILKEGEGAPVVVVG